MKCQEKKSMHPDHKKIYVKTGKAVGEIWKEQKKKGDI